LLFRLRSCDLYIPIPSAEPIATTIGTQTILLFERGDGGMGGGLKSGDLGHGETGGGPRGGDCGNGETGGGPKGGD
jgi:hypothetical protein